MSKDIKSKLEKGTVHEANMLCATCNRIEADHDDEANGDNNCTSFETADQRSKRELEENALRSYEVHSEQDDQ